MSESFTLAVVTITSIIVIVFMLVLSSRNTMVIMNVAECVQASSLADKFTGTLDQAWNTYAESCI